MLTSAGSGPFIVPGYGLLLELLEFEAAGLDRLDVLRAATLSYHRFFGEEAQAGTVEVGKRAELVLLRANPLESLKALREVEAVLHQNYFLDRPQIDEMVDAVAD